MKPAGPVETVELFPALSAELVGLLKNLPPSAWERPTACAGWSVRDVTAHLLGGNVGRLSFGRDRRFLPTSAAAPVSYETLVDYINRQNAAWVTLARRISPPLLIAFLELTDPQLYQYFKSLSPFETSRIGVAWAGETQSPNWFDIAREYTEKWLHQQHIREAVGQPLLAQRPWLFPVMDTFLRALPHTYRGVQGEEGDAVRVHILGEAGGDWSLIRRDGRWQLFVGTSSTASVSVYLDQDLAWRLFTKGISPDAARPRVRVEGDEALGMPMLQTVSIMA